MMNDPLALQSAVAAPRDRQVDVDAALDHRRRHHEDDEQHQHHVHQRHDVDFGERASTTRRPRPPRPDP